MAVNQASAENHARPAANTEAPNIGRGLALLVEGAALNMPEIDSPTYKLFRETISAMVKKIPDRLPETDLLPVVKAIICEFESYRYGTDSALREQQTGWRTLAGTLLHELLGALGIHPSSGSAAPLVGKIGTLASGEQIRAYQAMLDEFLHPGGSGGSTDDAAPANVSDRAAIDDGSGLRGGSAAQQHLQKVMDRGGKGFVVLFRLSCLGVIGERFGMEAVHSSLMAVSAFITQSLRSSDAVYRWSESSLLAILETPATEQMVTGTMQRIANNNRDITVQIENRNVMLRIPLSFELIPISRFQSSDDLFKLYREPVSKF
ncbi:MAG: diguanylate cyclase [Terracidiphilus sp.]